MSGQKRRDIFVLCRSFLAKLNKNWFEVSTAQHAVNEGAQFSENAL